MRRSLSAVFLAVLVVTACTADEPCPAGSDCRWLVDTSSVGLWLAADPEVAVVVRLDHPGWLGVTLFGVWERCVAGSCAWAPPITGGRLARHDDGAWTVSLARPAFAPDAAVEIVVPLADGSRLRTGLARRDDGRVATPRPDLPTCMSELRATLAAVPRVDGREALEEEIELACRIWIHPGQRRDAMNWHPTLHAVARTHACDMAERGFFDHMDPDGIGPNRRVRDAGYRLPYWYDGGDDGNNVESLALRAPISSPATTLQQWLESPLHRQHVLGESDFVAAQDAAATGYCRVNQDGLDKHFWAFISAHSAP